MNPILFVESILSCLWWWVRFEICMLSLAVLFVHVFHGSFEDMGCGFTRIRACWIANCWFLFCLLVFLLCDGSSSIAVEEVHLWERLAESSLGRSGLSGLLRGFDPHSSLQFIWIWPLLWFAIFICIWLKFACDAGRRAFGQPSFWIS